MSSSHFYRFSLVMLSLVCSLPLSAADNQGKQAGIKIRGTLIRDIGRSSCGKNTSKEAELVLDRDLLEKYDDFRIMKAAPGPKNEPEKMRCAATIADNQAKVEKISPQDLKFHEGFLLSDGQCKDKGSEGSNLLCVYAGESGAGELIAEARYTFDTRVALIDGIKEKTAINGTIQFKVETSGKVDKIELCYGKKNDGNIEADETCPKPFKSDKQSPPLITIKGLDNNTDYLVRMRTLDPSGGPGEWRKPEPFRPEPVAFPLELYDGAGNDIEWSCQTSNGSSFLFIAFMIIFMMCLRKRALKSSSALSVIILCLSLTSSKETKAEFGQMDISLVGSMYRPDLDNEKLGSGKVTPFYKNLFRKKTSDTDGPILPLLGFEADMRLFDNAGTLLLGLGAGYAQAQGHPVKVDGSGKPDFSSPVTSALTTLHMYQLRPQLTYLFDYAKEYFPLVPYIRGAFVLHGYSFTQSVETNTKPRVKPHGLMLGFQAAAGLRFYLDFLEPGAVRSARGSGFFNSVYLKGELSYTQINSFKDTGFNFSAKDVMGSELPLMWTFGLGFELP